MNKSRGSMFNCLKSLFEKMRMRMRRDYGVIRLMESFLSTRSEFVYREELVGEE